MVMANAKEIGNCLLHHWDGKVLALGMSLINHARDEHNLPPPTDGGLEYLPVDDTVHNQPGTVALAI